eukprot:scpid48685/ scgid5543/ 
MPSIDRQHNAGVVMANNTAYGCSSDLAVSANEGSQDSVATTNMETATHTRDDLTERGYETYASMSDLVAGTLDESDRCGSGANATPADNTYAMTHHNSTDQHSDGVSIDAYSCSQDSATGSDERPPVACEREDSDESRHDVYACISRVDVHSKTCHGRSNENAMHQNDAYGCVPACDSNAAPRPDATPSPEAHSYDQNCVRANDETSAGQRDDRHANDNVTYACVPHSAMLQGGNCSRGNEMETQYNVTYGYWKDSSASSSSRPARQKMDSGGNDNDVYTSVAGAAAFNTHGYRKDSSASSSSRLACQQTDIGSSDNDVYTSVAGAAAFDTDDHCNGSNLGMSDNAAYGDRRDSSMSSSAYFTLEKTDSCDNHDDVYTSVADAAAAFDNDDHCNGAEIDMHDNDAYACASAAASSCNNDSLALTAVPHTGVTQDGGARLHDGTPARRPNKSAANDYQMCSRNPGSAAFGDGNRGGDNGTEMHDNGACSLGQASADSSAQVRTCQQSDSGGDTHDIYDCVSDSARLHARTRTGRDDEIDMHRNDAYGLTPASNCGQNSPATNAEEALTCTHHDGKPSVGIPTCQQDGATSGCSGETYESIPHPTMVGQGNSIGEVDDIIMHDNDAYDCCHGSIGEVDDIIMHDNDAYDCCH